MSKTVKMLKRINPVLLALLILMLPTNFWQWLYYFILDLLGIPHIL